MKIITYNKDRTMVITYCCFHGRLITYLVVRFYAGRHQTARYGVDSRVHLIVR